jgi:acyl carrier protein
MMRVEEIIGKLFNVDPDELDNLSSRDTIEGWDSMGHLNLILGLEAEFKVSISIADAMEMVSVEKIRQILRNYGVHC